MHFRGLDLNLLVSLDALLSEQSVTRAAERVHVTQPAMSAALQKLRQYLGDPLLIRVGRHLELTPRARELTEPVKDLLHRVHLVINMQPAFDPTSARRTFGAAMSGYSAELLGVPVFRYLAEHAPGIAFQISDLTADAPRRVQNGELDLCITFEQGTLAGGTEMAEVLATRPLFSDRFVLVAAAENEDVGDNLTFDQFCSLPYIELRLGTNFMSVPDVTLGRQPRRPRAQGWMPTPQTAMAAASGSKAVAIVPNRLFALHRAGLRLKSVELPFEVPAINQICIWHPRNDTDPGHRWFLDLLRDQAPA